MKIKIITLFLTLCYFSTVVAATEEIISVGQVADITTMTLATVDPIYDSLKVKGVPKSPIVGYDSAGFESYTATTLPSVFTSTTRNESTGAVYPRIEQKPSYSNVSVPSTNKALLFHYGSTQDASLNLNTPLKDLAVFRFDFTTSDSWLSFPISFKDSSGNILAEINIGLTMDPRTIRIRENNGNWIIMPTLDLYGLTGNQLIQCAVVFDFEEGTFDVLTYVAGTTPLTTSVKRMPMKTISDNVAQVDMQLGYIWSDGSSNSGNVYVDNISFLQLDRKPLITLTQADATIYNNGTSSFLGTAILVNKNSGGQVTGIKSENVSLTTGTGKTIQFAQAGGIREVYIVKDTTKFELLATASSGTFAEPTQKNFTAQGNVGKLQRMLVLATAPDKTIATDGIVNTVKYINAGISATDGIYTMGVSLLDISIDGLYKVIVASDGYQISSILTTSEFSFVGEAAKLARLQQLITADAPTVLSLLTGTTPEAEQFQLAFSGMGVSSQIIQDLKNANDNYKNEFVRLLKKNAIADITKIAGIFNTVAALTEVNTSRTNSEILLQALVKNYALFQLPMAVDTPYGRLTDTQKLEFASSIIRKTSPLDDSLTITTIFDDVLTPIIYRYGNADDVMNMVLRRGANDGVNLDNISKLSKYDQSQTWKSMSGTSLDTPTLIATALNTIVNNKLQSAKSVSSSGGGGSKTVVTLPTITPEPPKIVDKYADDLYNVTPAFADLQNHTWAILSINALKDKNAISGRPDGKFYPDNNITREEFVKILISALFNDIKTSTQPTFIDVPKDEWFAPYITFAVEKKIINGQTENSFGIEQFITRQDMAVICYRALAFLEKEPKENLTKTPFKDWVDMDEYAILPIAAMQEAGYILGVSEDTFAPKNTATRAEAAKLIYNICKGL